jgi:poly-gamma-glutamate capsule biosynthesis protein CapA/YwtB (metallophosphatase superfamily)
MIRLKRVALWAGAVVACGGAAAGQTAGITVTLAGQSMIRSDVRETAPRAVGAVRGLLGGDVVFTNFEGAVAEKGETASEGRGFLSPPAALDALKAFGFNLLAMPGNHAFDLKAAGIRNTIREADARGMVHAGTGENAAGAAAPGYLRTAKGTVALVASASGMMAPGARAMAEGPGVNELRVEAGGVENEAMADLPGAGTNTPNAEDARRILESIRSARKKAAVVIVYQHNHVFGYHSFFTIFTEGMEERLRPNEWLRKWTHEEVDAGADVVVMHGAPLLHGIEIYRGKPIFYDLGNFIYNVPPTLYYIAEPMSWESVVAQVRFEGGKAASISLRPVVLNYVGEGQPDIHDPHAANRFLWTRGLPSPAAGARAGYILERVARLSREFGTRVEVRGERAEVRLQ